MMSHKEFLKIAREHHLDNEQMYLMIAYVLSPSFWGPDLASLTDDKAAHKIAKWIHDSEKFVAINKIVIDKVEIIRRKYERSSI